MTYQNARPIEMDRYYAVDDIFCRGDTSRMSWTVEVTEQFERWWEQLTEEETDFYRRNDPVLEAQGLALGEPYATAVAGSAVTICVNFACRTPNGPFACCTCRSSSKCCPVTHGDNEGLCRIHRPPAEIEQPKSSIPNS